MYGPISYRCTHHLMGNFPDGKEHDLFQFSYKLFLLELLQGDSGTLILNRRGHHMISQSNQRRPPKRSARLVSLRI